jgi:hypothetical protein
MIIAVTPVQSVEGTTMILESSVTVFEDCDLVSFDKESKKLSCGDNWQAESLRYHETLCQRILSKTAKSKD